MFECQYLKKRYKKKCGVDSCIAHIDSYNSGCILNSATTNLSLLAVLLNCDEISLEEELKRQTLVIKECLKIQKVLEDMPKHCYCTKCGRPKNLCNKKDCDTRNIEWLQNKRKWYMKLNPSEYFYLKSIKYKQQTVD